MSEELSDTEICYLELTATHAPQELGNAEVGRMVLLLLEENARLLDSQVVEEDLQGQLDMLENKYAELEDEMADLKTDLEEANEQIERLEQETDDQAEEIETLEEEVEDLKAQIE